MYAEDEKNGKVIFIEDKMPLKSWITIILIGFLLFFIFLAFLSLSGVPKSRILGLILFIFILSLVFLPRVLLRTERLEVYENGFKVPLTLLQEMRGKRKFINKNDIILINPRYNKIFIKVEGFTIITKNGEKIFLEDTYGKKNKIKTEELLKKILGSKWKNTFTDFPYISIKDIELFRKKVLKPEKVVIVETCIVMISPVALFFFGFLIDNSFLEAISVIFIFPSILIGIFLILLHYHFISKFIDLYNKIPEKHPLYREFVEIFRKKTRA